ncbi:MAG: hypothetical protein ACREYE_09615, partial [Gammaproteobacteria bacterium]
PHVSSGVRSAGCNLIATLVFGMSETIAITGKSVKLFKGHYTSRALPKEKHRTVSADAVQRPYAHLSRGGRDIEAQPRGQDREKNRIFPRGHRTLP